MQVPNRPVGAYGYSVRNYAPASLFPQYQGTQCASSTKPPSGKSFTIDALLAKPENTTGGRTSPSQCGVKYQPAAAASPVLPLTGHVGLPMAPAPYVYSPNMLHSAVHSQPGYSMYCCPPFTYQSTCRGAFYAQGKLSCCSDLTEPTKQNSQRMKKKPSRDSVIDSFSLSLLHSFNVQSQCRSALVQEQRWEVQADAHQLHQRAAVPAGEGVCPAAVHGRLGEVPPGLRSAAHRGSGVYFYGQQILLLLFFWHFKACAQTHTCNVSNVPLIYLSPGQSLVPEPTHQVAQTESGAAAGQTGQTGPGCSAEKSRISGTRRWRRRGWGVLWLWCGHWRVWWLHRPLLTLQHWT